MILSIYKKALSILVKMPFKLWGLSLLNGFLAILISTFGVLPIITIPVTAALTAGMAAVYLTGYRGKEVYSDQLFSGFKNFGHVAGGMCWRQLWVLLWLLVPVAGPVLAIIKTLSYAFTPYILNEEPNVNATEALRKSMKDTQGYKAPMFAAIILPVIAFMVVVIVLTLLSAIPFIGLIFAFINFIIILVYALFAPLFLGLVEAGFYEYAKNPASAFIPATPQYIPPQQPPVSGPAKTCPACDSQNAPGATFCLKCGSKLD